MTLVDFDRSLVADKYWGRGFGDRAYTPEDLEEAARYVGETQQPGYGPRMFAWADGLEINEDNFVLLPSGYDATGHPKRNGKDPAFLDEDFPTKVVNPRQVPESLQAYFRLRDWTLDQHGRACNPLAKQLTSHPGIGLNTGIGYSYYLAEQTVVDVVVEDEGGNTLYTTRRPNGVLIPSLVGGYAKPVDYDVSLTEWLAGKRPVSVEGIYVTAARKVLEETGVRLPTSTSMQVTRAIRPTSSPQTWQFWTATYTVHARVSQLAQRELDPLRDGRIMSRHQRDAVVDFMWPDHQAGMWSAVEHS